MIIEPKNKEVKFIEFAFIDGEPTDVTTVHVCSKIKIEGGEVTFKGERERQWRRFTGKSVHAVYVDGALVIVQEYIWHDGEMHSVVELIDTMQLLELLSE